MSCNPDESIDPRVRRTRKLLQDALSSLMQEKEFGDISVQDIAARATVNRATFYAHYADKQELAGSILRTGLHRALYSRFEERPPLTPETLVELAVATFEYFGEMHARCPKTSEAIQAAGMGQIQEELHTMLTGLLSSSAQFGRFFPGSTKETVATVLSWSIYGGAWQWSRAKRRVPAKTICCEIVAIILAKQSAPVLTPA